MRKCLLNVWWGTVCYTCPLPFKAYCDALPAVLLRYGKATLWRSDSPTHSGFPTLMYFPAHCSYRHPFQSTNIRLIGLERWIIMKVDRKTSPFVHIAISGQFLVTFSIFLLQPVTAFPEAAIGKRVSTLSITHSLMDSQKCLNKE